jgi:hypothetical protein
VLDDNSSPLGRGRVRALFFSPFGSTPSRSLAIKVVDIFGNDTMTIIETTVGTKQEH